MDERVSAAEANRSFSRILRGAREGRSFVVTSHGRPVARISPVANGEEEVRARAVVRLLNRLGHQAAVDIGEWSRDELYDEEP